MNGASRSTPTRSPTPSAEHTVLTLWTDSAELARHGDLAGVDRIGVDLERLGKAERQLGRGTWISPHEIDDLDQVRGSLSHSALFARTNPLNPGSRLEVEQVLERGAQVLMLPMVLHACEAAEFVELVDGRATVVMLVEHIDAIGRIDEIASVSGVDEIHIGLNDLALSLGLHNRWMALAGDMLVEAGRVVRAAGRRFGLGGIGRAGDDDLPVPADLVYAEYARTGARAALLSRSFVLAAGDLAAEVAAARKALARWQRRPPAELATAHRELSVRARTATVW